jgi:NNP family nitrate/nitrite transporter-like MFS transporter
VLIAWGWQAVAQIWAAALVAMALVFWFCASDPPATEGAPAKKRFLDEFAALKKLQVWRFGLYYFFTFGAFVALALWLPRYLIGVYGFEIAAAGILAAFFSVPGSIFRAYGGVLSDRVGARTVMYWTLGVSGIAALILSVPPANILVQGITGTRAVHFEIGPVVFVAIVFVLGFFMSLGKAAVYKHIPTYYPNDVGAVGGLVGMIGGLGGFILPLAFGVLNDVTGLWQSCFMLLFLLAAISLAWMHVAIRQIEREAHNAPVEPQTYAPQDA